MATNRADAFAIWYMPESTYGVDPGIVAAAFVDGTTEAYKYVPTTALKAYARITGKVDGLPRRTMVEAEQVFPVTDSDPFRAKGPRAGGNTFSFEMLVHGGLLDDPSERPIPTPWAQLAASACGRIIGHRGTDSGGGNGTANYTTLGPSFVASDYFDIQAGAGTVGTTAAGHVLGVDVGTGTSTPNIQLVRPVRCATNAEVGDASASENGLAYSGVSLSVPYSPAVDDRVYFTSQVNFDRRLEDYGDHGAGTQLSYTMLILRPDADSIQLITGVKCNEFEITDNAGEIPRIKLSFHFKHFYTFGEDGTAAFGGTPAIADEPEYYSNWPCPKVTTGSNVVFLKYTDSDEDGTYETPSVVRDLALTNFNLKWNAGYTVRHSNMATETIEDLRQTQRQSLEIKFTTLYYDDWRDMLGLCQAVDGTNARNTFPFIYWTGDKRSQLWFVASPSLHLKEDPGPGDGDFEGNQSQEIVLGMRPWSGDRNAAGTAAASWAYDTTPQTRFCLGTM